MPAMPLTNARWSGLPLLKCNMDPGLYRIDVHTPMLIIRDDVGTNVEVFGRSGGRVVFRQAPLRFDLFAAGLQMNAVSDRLATVSYVVALPPGWMPFDHGLPDDSTGLQARFQFSDAELRRLVGRLMAHHQHDEPLGDSYTQAVSRTIVDRVVRLQLAREAKDPDAVGLDPQARRLVEGLIDARLHEPLTSSTLASSLGMGVVRFVREFKRTFAATPHQYLHQRRLARAREMMLATDATLTTIAVETGFASHSHFSTAFRAEMGMSPSHYRRTRIRQRGTAPAP